METQERDILYKITLGFWHNGLRIQIHEYVVVNETAKSYMAKHTRNGVRDSDSVRFSKEEIDEPILDAYVGHLHGAKLTMYECTREEVEEFGVPKLKNAVREWLTNHRDYYDNYLKELDKDGGTEV